MDSNQIIKPELLEDEAPHQRAYRHVACGMLVAAGEYDEFSSCMPCPTCGSVPPQKEFTWE